MAIEHQIRSRPAEKAQAPMAINTVVGCSLLAVSSIALVVATGQKLPAGGSILPARIATGHEPAVEPMGDEQVASVVGGPILCYVFNYKFHDIAGPSDAIFVNGSRQSCIPGGENGICRGYFGRCFVRAPVLGHVLFQAFDDGHTNVSYPADAVYIDASTHRACVSSFSDVVDHDECHKWFGPYESTTTNFRLFDDGYTSVIGPTGAIFYDNNGRLCMPGGPDGICRKWFGRGARE